jgi:3-deoxy-manno-octulosonate cytidylyltransferase (CMP-KDO synthetase)
METLLEVSSINESYLETSENVEALRWIENDYNVKVALTDNDSIEINTPEDLEELLKLQTPPLL